MLLVFFSLVTGALTASHWVVTNNGRIEANVRSSNHIAHIQTAGDFHMVQGHDLVQFLKQEERVAHLANVERSMATSDPKVLAAARLVSPTERIFYDEECLGAHETTKWQLIVTSALPLTGVDVPALIGRPAFDPDDTVENPLRPSCGDDLLALPFSMHAFEHLDSMRDRAKLNGGRPHDEFVPDDFVTAKMFGHHVAQAMYTHNGTADMWAVLVLAAHYWRMEGNSLEAIECSRRALHLVPRRHSIVPLLDLANVLLDARRADDAIVVLDALLAVNETVSEAYCKSGEAYALSDTPNYNASLYSFDACLLLREGAEGAERARQYVLCQLHLLHERGDAPIHEDDVLMRAGEARTVVYEEHARAQTLMTARTEIGTHTMDKRAVAELDMLYEWHVGGGSPCYYDKSTPTRHRMTCPLGTRQPVRASPPETDDTPARRPRDQPATVTDDPGTYLETVRQANVSTREWFHHGAARYPLTSVDHLFPSDWVFQDEAWPSTTLCRKSRARLPTRRDMPSLFVTADSKGYSMRDVLETRLQLEKQAQHPLPWHPPRCASPEKVPVCDSMAGVLRLQTLHYNEDGRYAEAQLTLALTNLTGTVLDSPHDIGQRLLTARQLGIAPRWLVEHAAALYWRVRGAPNEAVACLRGVLHDVQTPDDIRAAALNQMAQLVERLGGRLDHALKLIRIAQELDPFEPAHHLLAALYSITGNAADLPWAAEQLRAALDLDPIFPAALSTLRAVKCTLKEHTAAPPPVVQKRKVAKPRTPPKTMPNHFCLRLTDEKMGCVTAGRGTSVEHAWTRSPTDVTCVRPPSLLAMFLPFYERVVDGDSDDEVNAHQTAMLLSAFDRHVRQGAYARALAICQLAGYPWTSRHASKPRTREQSVVDTSDEVALDHDNSDEVLSPAVHIELHLDESPVERVMPHVPVEGVQQTSAHTPSAPVNVRVLTAIDVPMPSAIPRARREDVLEGVRHVGELPSTPQLCALLRHQVPLDQATSTWLSVTASGINLADFIDFDAPIDDVHALPYCPAVDRPGMFTMEHLTGAEMADDLLGHYQPEHGLRDALEHLGGARARQSTQEMAARIAMAMARSTSDVHWTVSTAASLYWRVKGEARYAIDCLKHALDSSPNDVRDVTLVSLANVYHQLSLLHSALIAGGAAMDTSPRLVVIHFTMANIYAALGDIEMALEFYMSTLALQHNFEPARQRIHAIYCMTEGELPKHIERALRALEADGTRPKRTPFTA